MKLLDLGPDEWLTGARFVRMCSDLERPLKREAIREGVDAGLHADRS